LGQDDHSRWSEPRTWSPGMRDDKPPGSGEEIPGPPGIPPAEKPGFVGGPDGGDARSPAIRASSWDHPGGRGAPTDLSSNRPLPLIRPSDPDPPELSPGNRRTQGVVDHIRPELPDRVRRGGPRAIAPIPWRPVEFMNLYATRRRSLKIVLGNWRA